jgi:hypothetical protein
MNPFHSVPTVRFAALLAGAPGLLLRVKGDGRTDQCDLRASRMRLPPADREPAGAS